MREYPSLSTDRRTKQRDHRDGPYRMPRTLHLYDAIVRPVTFCSINEFMSNRYPDGHILDVYGTGNFLNEVRDPLSHPNGYPGVTIGIDDLRSDEQKISDAKNHRVFIPSTIYSEFLNDRIRSYFQNEHIPGFQLAVAFPQSYLERQGDTSGFVGYALPSFQDQWNITQHVWQYLDPNDSVLITNYKFDTIHEFIKADGFLREYQDNSRKSHCEYIALQHDYNAIMNIHAITAQIQRTAQSPVQLPPVK